MKKTKTEWLFSIVFSLIGLGIIIGGISFAEEGKIGIEVTNLKTRAVIENKIIGSFEVENTTDVYSNDLYYVVSLVSQEMVFQEGTAKSLNAVLSQSEPKQFSLSARESKLMVFEYIVPQYVSNEETMIVISFMSKTTSFTKIVGIGTFELGESENNILPSDYANTHSWQQGSFKSSLSGPSFDMGETPIGYIPIKSTFNNQITVIPEFTVYKRLQTYQDEPVGVFKGEEIKINKNEAKELEIKFPKIEEPDSYFVKVVLKNSSGTPVSYEYFFRYVVKGVNAKILGISTEYSEENKDLDIIVYYVGPADGSTIENAEIDMRIYNSSNKEISRVSESIILMSYSFNLTKTVPVENIGEDMRVVVTIRYDNKVLDSRECEIEGKATKEPEEGIKFSDIEGTNCADAVKLLNSLGIISGYPDGSFKPQNSITRAEMTAIALRLKGIDIGKAIQPVNAFSDVAKDHWANKTINVAYNNGIINGYGDGLFKPDNNVTYAEAITILLNVAGYRGEVVNSKLEWPLNYIIKASQLRIQDELKLENYGNPANRGDIAIMTFNTYIRR